MKLNPCHYFQNTSEQLNSSAIPKHLIHMQEDVFKGKHNTKLMTKQADRTASVVICSEENWNVIILFLSKLNQKRTTSDLYMLLSSETAIQSWDNGVFVDMSRSPQLPRTSSLKWQTFLSQSERQLPPGILEARSSNPVQKPPNFTYVFCTYGT